MQRPQNDQYTEITKVLELAEEIGSVEVYRLLDIDGPRKIWRICGESLQKRADGSTYHDEFDEDFDSIEEVTAALLEILPGMTVVFAHPEYVDQLLPGESGDPSWYSEKTGLDTLGFCE